MDVSVITQLIGSVGFPIVMCFVLVYYMEKSEESHKEEINSLKEALNNNTNILTKLETLINERLDNYEDADKK